MINSPKKPQLIKSKYFKKTYTYFSANQVSAFLIKITYFENLYIINIITLNLSLVNNSTSTKSRIKIKKIINGNFINYNNL